MHGRTRGRVFLLLAVGLSVVAAFLANLAVSTLLDREPEPVKSVLTAAVVGAFIALVFLARRGGDFEVEEVRPAPAGAEDDAFVAEGVRGPDEEDRRRR